MARLRQNSPDNQNDSDYRRAKGPLKPIMQPQPTTQARVSPRKKAYSRFQTHAQSEDEDSDSPLELIPKTVPAISPRKKQVRLTPLGGLNNGTASLDLKPGRRVNTLLDEPSPRKVSSARIRHVKSKLSLSKLDDSFLNQPAQPKPSSAQATIVKAELEPMEVDGRIEEVEIEESVCCGSDADSSDPSDDDDDDELLSPRKFVPPPRQRTTQLDLSFDLARSLKSLRIYDSQEATSPASAPATIKPNAVIHAVSRPSSSSDKENTDAVLRFSPPRLYNVKKHEYVERAVTPPLSPTKGKLLSPSKKKQCIPTAPHRQSGDAFWSVEELNEWNDHYSPRKEWNSPKKLNIPFRDASSPPTSSPRKPQNPSKRTKAELIAKKDWESRKHALAASFLTELDQTITSGQLAHLAASTGGIQILWSKTLTSTAGRANWRHNTVSTTHLDGTATTLHYHHASIELAEKVVDDEPRLLNVVAHEFCHLANFMVLGKKDQVHGKDFKDWGCKASRAFAHRGVEVMTKHTYAIEYKYIWECACGEQYKRHSKSIDPARKVCGKCRGRLVQVKPVPRKEGNGNGYAGFVKKHFKAVKGEMPAGSSQKEVMEAVAMKYRAEKAEKGGRDKALLPPSEEVEEVGQAEADEVARVLKFIVSDDD